MGKLEQQGREKRSRDYLQRIILDSVAAAGVLSIGLIAPNVLKAMHKVGILPRPRHSQYISSSASKLVRRGLLKFINGHYELTLEGEKILRRWEFSAYRLSKPRRWDQKWRMLIFDIPERKRRVRRQVDRLFKQAGFYRLQDSVWVYPYDCEDVIGVLKTDLGVGRELLYVIAEEIENDKHLRQEFGLL